MGCTYQNCSFSRGKDAKAVPIKTVVSATDKARRESVKTVAFEQLPVYVPAHDGRQKHGRALMTTRPNTLPLMFRFFASPTHGAGHAWAMLTDWLGFWARFRFLIGRMIYE